MLMVTCTSPASVGTGSSATQVVPAIQPMVKHLYVFQREPGWVVPKGERDFTDEERAAFAKSWRRLRERWRLKYMLEKSLWRGHLYRPGTKTNATVIQVNEPKPKTEVTRAGLALLRLVTETNRLTIEF